MNDFVEKNFQVWSVKLDQSVVPTLLPRVELQMERLTFNRVPSEECVILYLCMPTMGIVGSVKLQFVLQMITALLAARPSNSIAVVIHANRAENPKKRSGFQTLCVLIHIACK